VVFEGIVAAEIKAPRLEVPDDADSSVEKELIFANKSIDG
jgi:hypothetical protein